MSDCHREEENLSVFVDGELPTGQQRTLARHLLDCPECAARVGRLLAVKYYLGANAEEPKRLEPGFWGRLEQALDLVDAVAARAARRPAPAAPVRRAWSLAGAGVFLILAAWVLRLATLPPPVQLEALARAHEGLVLQVAQGPIIPASWVPGHAERTGRTWLPQARLDQALGTTGISHRLYSVSSLELSAFTLPSSGLPCKRMMPVQVDMEQFYMATGGATSLVAWRDGDGWQVLAGDTSPTQLLALARGFARAERP